MKQAQLYVWHVAVQDPPHKCLPDLKALIHGVQPGIQYFKSLNVAVCCCDWQRVRADVIGGSLSLCVQPEAEPITFNLDSVQDFPITTLAFAPLSMAFMARSS